MGIQSYNMKFLGLLSVFCLMVCALSPPPPSSPVSRPSQHPSQEALCWPVRRAPWPPSPPLLSSSRRRLSQKECWELLSWPAGTGDLLTSWSTSHTTEYRLHTVYNNYKCFGKYQKKQ